MKQEENNTPAMEPFVLELTIHVVFFSLKTTPNMKAKIDYFHNPPFTLSTTTAFSMCVTTDLYPNELALWMWPGPPLES